MGAQAGNAPKIGTAGPPLREQPLSVPLLAQRRAVRALERRHDTPNAPVHLGVAERAVGAEAQREGEALRARRDAVAAVDVEEARLEQERLAQPRGSSRAADLRPFPSGTTTATSRSTAGCREIGA